MNAPQETSSLEPLPAQPQGHHDDNNSNNNNNNTPDLEKHHGNTSTPTLDDISMDLEKLGRQRPAAFSSTFREVIFCSSLLISMLMAEFFISGFNIILPDVSHALSIPTADQIWPASVFSLVTGAFLLPLGRVADIYGAYIVFTSGLVWFFIWTLASGFATNYTMLIATRALGGFGPAAFMPSTVMLVGKTYRPGPRKNLVFGLYCAFAPIGFFLGIIIGGTVTQLLEWRWYFWLGSIVLFITCVMAYVTVPNDFKATRRENAHIKMDWWGVLTVVPGLVLVTFAITAGAHASQGWNSPYILATFIPGVVFLGAAFYIEGWVAEQPLLPFDLFQPRYMGRLAVSMFFAYGVFGIFLFYASLHISQYMHASALKTAVWFSPMAAGGIILATVGGCTLHLLPGRVVLIISGIGSVFSVLLFAIIPEDGGYWAYVFPAMVGCTIGVDITYLISNTFITTNVPRRRQGLAGGLINSLLFLGISFFLGMADLAVSEDLKRHPDGLGHKVAFWFATACAGVALLIFLTIKIPKAESELTMEEKEERDQRMRALERATGEKSVI